MAFATLMIAHHTAVAEASFSAREKNTAMDLVDIHALGMDKEMAEEFRIQYSKMHLDWEAWEAYYDNGKPDPYKCGGCLWLRQVVLHGIRDRFLEMSVSTLCGEAFRKEQVAQTFGLSEFDGEDLALRVLGKGCMLLVKKMGIIDKVEDKMNRAQITAKVNQVCTNTTKLCPTGTDIHVGHCDKNIGALGFARGRSSLSCWNSHRIGFRTKLCKRRSHGECGHDCCYWRTSYPGYESVGHAEKWSAATVVHRSLSVYVPAISAVAVVGASGMVAVALLVAYRRASSHRSAVRPQPLATDDVALLRTTGSSLPVNA